MATKCPKCHTENPDTSRFCADCGTQLGPAKEVPPLTESLKKPTPTIDPGTVFAGRYEIIEKIGEGGMGEVYRALDKNLSRSIAIKILPDAFAEDKERLARFEREAKLLAVLNHPNIAAIHGLEETEGRRFLVLEMAEGETLKTRLDRGRIGVEETMELCLQIAEGLEAAHEKGIIHRDLKPGNIMITSEGKVKILDFGLAKAYLPESSAIDIATSPTITAQMTEPGVILGTAGYMSPEQARGRSADKRADVWAFGCIFYECLTGKRAFPGDTVSDTLALILKGEPDWTALPQDTPTAIRVLLRRCLQKDTKNRLHDIADARLEISSPTVYPSEALPAARRFSFMWLAACAAVMLLAGILIDQIFIKHPQSALSPPVVTSIIKVDPGRCLAGMQIIYETGHPSRTAMAISSDGRFVVYSAIEENPGPQANPGLFLLGLEQLEAKPIAGTEGGTNPFLSPDNRWVGFWADGKLKKVPVEGGVPGILCDASLLFGANWGPDNNIVFADGENTGLLKVSAEGGNPEILTKPDPKREEYGHRLPYCLPSGKGVLFTVMRHGWDRQPWLCLLRPNAPEWNVLIQDAADARYVPTGHVVFLRQGTLMAVRFDLGKLQVVGQPVALVDNIVQAFTTNSRYHTGAGQFGVSDTGTLVYVAGGIVPVRKNSLVWVDQRGREQPVMDLKFPFTQPRLSPDGQRIAYGIQEGEVWIYDLVRGTNSRLAREGRAAWPIWTPDGKRLVFEWQKSVVSNLFWQPYDGSSPMERLTTSEYNQAPGSCAPDGKTVALVELHPNDQFDISMLDVRSGRATPFLNSQFSEQYPEFSPDGRWIAYSSDESKRDEVYVRPFPGPGMKQQVSSEGGRAPVWARNGKQLFYRWWDQFWVVDVRTDGDFTSGRPRLLFEQPGYRRTVPLRCYDLSLDGQRFLMVKLEQMKPSPLTEITIVLNWFEQLKRLVPAEKK